MTKLSRLYPNAAAPHTDGTPNYDGPLIEVILGKNIQGEPTLAYVFKPDHPEALKGWWADGNEVIGVDDEEEPTVLIQFVVPGDSIEDVMPLCFGEFGLAELRKTLAR